MKKVSCLFLTALYMLIALSGCGCSGGENADLVFLNDSDSTVVAVMADFSDQASVMQRAVSCPLKRGETFGFEAGEYPLTVVVYDKPFEGVGQKELGLLTIQHAPPEGERWYVTAWDGGSGILLAADTSWPEGA